MTDVQPQRGDAETAGQDRRQTTPADVTREPTGGQELREAITTALDGDWGDERFEIADDLLALPELATLIADADNWRRVTTGDPTEPEPLAMQARELLVRNRELEATVARVRELLERRIRGQRCISTVALDRALDGEPQP